MANRRALGFICCAVLCTALCATVYAAGPITIWTRAADMQVQRGYHTMTPIGPGKVLVVGGIPVVDVTKAAEVYDLTTNSWAYTPQTVYQHARHQAVKLADGRIMVIGGIVSGKNAEIYNPANNTWVATADMSVARYGHTATLMKDGRVLVAGGWDDTLGRSVKTVEIYNPANDSWSLAPSLLFRRAFHTAVLLPDGKILVAGGNSGSGNRSSIELYDPATGKWIRGTDMNDARSNHAMTVVHGIAQTWVVAAGGCCVGSSGTALNTAEVYSVSSGQWARTGNMATARMEVGMTTLPNGNVVIAGGENQEVFTGSAELLDMGTRTFRALGSIPVKAAELPLATMSDGTVIVAGGTTNDDNIRSTEAVATFKP
ncbi:MAG: kelch repeat-containing protein [Acidobacteriota bacterium]